MAGLDDGVLKMFIDQAFDLYDNDRSGTLDVNQLHTFLNKLNIQLNEPRRYTLEETKEFLRTFDLQRNGVITKPELFIFFKRLSSGGFSQGHQQPPPPPPPQYPPQQYPQPQYGQQPYPYQQQQPYPQQYGQPGQYPQQPPQPIYIIQQGNNAPVQGTDPNNPYMRHG